MSELNGLDSDLPSMEHRDFFPKRSDLFPKKKLISEDENLKVPFPLLSGECAEFLGRTKDGIIVLSNFRLLIRYKESFINVSLGLIDIVEIQDIFYLNIYCKDATVIRCAFPSNEACQDWHKRLLTKTAPKSKIEDVFAFAFHAWCDPSLAQDQYVNESCNQLCRLDRLSPYNFTKEIERLHFDMKTAWRYTDINKTFGLCATYPSEHIVPKSVSDENLQKIAGFRALQRFPSIIWRNRQNGAVLVRSSQPEMGFFGWRNTDDENLLNAIPVACAKNPGTKNRRLMKEDSSGSDFSSDDSTTAEKENCLNSDSEPKKMLIIDCRSYTAAFANRAKGGGVECPEYYQSCEIQFMNLVNIHAIRKSFVAFRNLCSSGIDQMSWLSALENTKWLQYLASLLKAAVLVVNANDKEGRPVLVHCSDGWDRTPQILALAELLLDPYYRTVEGFQVLIEREWLHFGHKFADRCGNGVHTDDVNERCPVFLQWLECVYQLLVQFPCHFEFNEAFLVKLVQHTYSCLFGTFLCNTVQDRDKLNLHKQTASLWSLLNDKKFYNHLYSPSPDFEVLYPVTHVQSLKLWTSIYLSNNSSFAGPEETSAQTILVSESSEMSSLPKTRSCENLLLLNDLNSSLSRRKSDPNITVDHCDQQTQKLITDAMSGDASCSSSESLKCSDEESSQLLSDSSGPTINGISDPVGVDLKHLKVNDLKKNGSNGVIKIDEHNELNKCQENNIIGAVVGSHENASISMGVEANNSIDNDNVNDIVVQEEVHDLNKENRIIIEGYNVGYNKEDDECKHNENGLNKNGSWKELDGLGLDNVKYINNYINERNGNPSTSLERVHSSDSCNSENSIETISESEENCDKTTENTKNSASVICNTKLIENEHLTMSSSFHSCNSDITRISDIKEVPTKAAIKQDTILTLLESSTDTLTDELLHGDSSQTPMPSPNPSKEHMYKVSSEPELCHDVVYNIKYIDIANSISTSTSDLTDSSVRGNNVHVPNCFPREALLNIEDFNHHSRIKMCCVLSQGGIPRGTNGACKGVTVDTSFITPLHTPISPLSRTSTCPPTPGTCDPKSDPTNPRLGLTRHLDNDGLTTFSDLIQKQVEAIKRTYEQEISKLHDQLAQLNNLLSQHASACNGDLCNLEFRNGNESPRSLDMQSIKSNYSNAASDASWDQMENDPETNITRWVPDHTVTQCANCDIAFGLLIRKHHCRNCGLIFCHNCSKDTIPLPHQMIHSEERVCEKCYSKMFNQLMKSVITFDNGISEYNPLAGVASN